MYRKQIKSIKTKEDARSYAIDWQHWQSKQNLSYAEIIKWADVFGKLAKKFRLIKEFKENGII